MVCMKGAEPGSLMYEVINLRDRINLVASRLGGDRLIVFHPVSLPMPCFDAPELGFLRTVSWLYVLVYEAGSPSIGFLSKRIHLSQPDAIDRNPAFLRLIHDLRTYLQHNLDPAGKRSIEIQEVCEEWFRQNCGTRVPHSEDNWYVCLSSLLTEVVGFLKATQ